MQIQVYVSAHTLLHITHNHTCISATARTPASTHKHPATTRTHMIHLTETRAGGAGLKHKQQENIDAGPAKNGHRGTCNARMKFTSVELALSTRVGG
jgi:hypothetical protein